MMVLVVVVGVVSDMMALVVVVVLAKHVLFPFSTWFLTCVSLRKAESNGIQTNLPASAASPPMTPRTMCERA